MEKKIKEEIKSLRAQIERGQADEALATIEMLLTRYEDSEAKWRLCELAGACCEQLLNAEGIAAWYLRAAYADTILRSQREHFSNYLFALHYLPDIAAGDLAHQHMGYAMLYQDEERLPARAPHSSGPLAIGYIAPSFCESSSARFYDVMLTGLDPHDYRIYAYSLSGERDEYAQSLADRAEIGYRSLAGLSVAEAADAIRADDIDILVDLGGHSQGGDTLMIAARRPAPVNVTGIGYFSTTGLPGDRMDYFLTDDIMDRTHRDVPGLPEGDIYFSEHLLRLPHGFCFTPSAAMRSRRLRLRTARPDGGRAMVFGALGNFLKISRPVLSVWHDILEAVPGSRLVLQDTMCLERRREALMDQMRHDGWGDMLDRDRVDLRLGSDDYLAEYSAIDIVLDTFPYPGGATTATALYMGRPVVTLAGDRHGSRIGASLLTAAQHEEWIAHDEQEYKDIAVRLARAPEALAHSQLTLRHELEVSPLLDRRAYACALGELYHTIAALARVQASLRAQAGETALTQEASR